MMMRVKNQMKLGSAQASMATHALERQAEFGLTDGELAYALSTPWAAGVGTVSLQMYDLGCADVFLRLYPRWKLRSVSPLGCI